MRVWSSFRVAILLPAVMCGLATSTIVLAGPPGAGADIDVFEYYRAITIGTRKLEATIPKKEPKQWMTGIEKGSFLDKATGFREVGDGLMVVDWLMEAGSDEAYRDQLRETDRYLWYS